MARVLNFSSNGEQFPLEIEKLDRKKLYGWTEKLVVDANEDICETLSFASDENLIIPSGGVGHATLDEDGNWVDKSDLVTITELGEEAILKPSSFKGEILLEEIVQVEDIFEHNISSIYFLTGVSEKLLEIVKSINGFFTFEFNYRDSYAGTPAFLVESNNNLFLLIGNRIEFEFLSLEQEAEVDEDDEDDEDDDEFDFGSF